MHVLILAAGASTRLGQPKQLVTLGGRPALHRVIASAAELNRPITVVVGARAPELSRLLAQSPVSVVVNRHWEEGLASSLRAGIAALPPGCEAVLVLLGDQVAVTGDDLKKLVAAWRGEPSLLAAAAYDGHAGVPAIFPHICFGELNELRGDRGARTVLERNSYRVVRVPMPNAALDLDTPEDLTALQARYAAATP